MHGTSLGAGVTLSTLSSSPLAQKLKGFIIENTFTSLGDMADMLYPKLKVFRRMILRNFWDNDQYVKRLPKHLSALFITGKKDEITPTHMVKSIYQDCILENKSLMELENGMHNNTWFVHREEYFDRVNKFIKNLFK